MHTAIQCLELVFGRGDDNYPFWLLTVRLNILVFLLASVLAIRRSASPARLRRVPAAAWWTVAGLTVLAGILRFGVAGSNLFDFGGIPYSRLLYGYKGYFATAQFFAPLYELTNRDIEHGIFFQRIAGTLTVPVVYALCRRTGSEVFAALAAFLFAVYPLHVLFSASDSLAVFTTFLAASGYLLVAIAVDQEDADVARLHSLAGFSGLALLTQARPENALLVLPPVLVLLARRRGLQPGRLAVSLAVAGAFAAVYAYEAATVGFGRRNAVDIERGVSLVIEHLVLNPFLAIPVLLLATAAIGVYRGAGWMLLAVLPWCAAVVLCVLTVEDGHGAARLYANWLILILPFAAYGIALLWRAPRWAARVVAALAVVYFAALPLIVRHRLAAQYLEILEHDRFNAALGSLPVEVERVIVPDDELMWRRYGSTLEAYRKYEAIHRSRPPLAQRVQLVGLTEYLGQPQATGCAGGACVFFSGVPCMDQALYTVTREQCEELLHTHRTSLLTESAVVAAPFVACSIYTGELQRELCEPATASRSFKVYRIED